MKEVRIYHRKDLIEKLKLMIYALEFFKASHRALGYPDNLMVKLDSDNWARNIRQFRIRYGIYECF